MHRIVFDFGMTGGGASGDAEISQSRKASGKVVSGSSHLKPIFSDKFFPEKLNFFGSMVNFFAGKFPYLILYSIKNCC